uniref:Uncharacterized protein n=1 Tax=Pipistrellus kuhlii TaxID=59472 RepID=A0A7J7ZJS5_PIPKU|nr:hypothetical protein mPipKuh1_009508 [Pipistrellus kuhlii]
MHYDRKNMRPKNLLLDPDSPRLSKLLAGGSATVNPLLMVTDPPQLLFYPVDVNVVMTPTTPYYRLQVPGGPSEISLTCTLPEAELSSLELGSMLGPLLQFLPDDPGHSLPLKRVSPSAPEDLYPSSLDLSNCKRSNEQLTFCS